MTKHPVALAIALALSISVVLPGCDSTANLTEQEHIRRAKDFEDKGQFKGSIVELKNAIQKNPDSPQARLLLGQVYLKVGMGAEAEKELTQAKKLGISQETINPQLGEALLLEGEYKRVLDEIQPSEQTTKTNLARIWQIRADALLNMGQLKDACNLYQQSLDNDTSNPPTYWGLAQCAVAERDVTKAREYLDKALKIKDKQAKTWIIVGKLEHLNNNIEAAISAYTSALEVEPKNIEALQSRAVINTTLGRMDPARIDIEKIRKLAPKSLAANYLQALLDFREKRYPEARDALQETLKIAPDYLPALLLGSSIEFALGNLQTAESHLNKVVRAAPNNGFALRMLAFTQLRQGRTDDAAKTLAPFDLEKVKDAGVLAVAGEIAVARGEYSKAAGYFEKAAELSPDSADIRTKLGMARLVQGDDRAMADLQVAADMGGPDTRVDHVIILNQLKQMQFDPALDSIAALEKKQPQSPLPWNYRGAAYLGKKDIGKARSSFDQALKLDPKFFPAALSLARLDILDKKPESARKHFEAILDKDKNNVRAMLALADLAAARKQENEYVKWLEKAAKASPDTVEPIAGLVNHYLAKKENQKALDQARKASSAHPDSLQAMNLLGETQLATGDYSAAIATYSRMTLKAPQSSEAYLRLALAQMADKQLAAARDSLKKAIQLKPDYLKAQDALLRLELADNRPDAALKIARQIQNQQTKSPLGFDREADILLSQKSYPQAIKAYEQSLTKGAGTAGMIKLHRAHLMAGDTKAADQRLAGWIKQHPKDMEARTFAAEIYMRTKRNRDAIAQYEELLKSTPNNVIALNNLAILYQREKDSRAMATAEQALKLAPNQPGVLDTLGWILVEQDNLPRAMGLLRKAAANAPKDGTIRYHYGEVLARSGNKAGAKNEIEAAIATGQKFPELEEAKALLKTL